MMQSAIKKAILPTTRTKLAHVIVKSNKDFIVVPLHTHLGDYEAIARNIGTHIVIEDKNGKLIEKVEITKKPLIKKDKREDKPVNDKPVFKSGNKSKDILSDIGDK